MMSARLRGSAPRRRDPMVPAADADPNPAVERDSSYWDGVADAVREGEVRLPRILAGMKRATHLRLVEEWGGDLDTSRILKTDLFEESGGEDGFLGDLDRPANELHGLDVSHRTVRAAAERSAPVRVRGVVADVRRLPYRDGVFDLVVSNSTLDHFDAFESIRSALNELARVLAAGGVLIVTLDNPRNIFHPLLRLADWAGRIPYRLGVTLPARQLAATLRNSGLEVTDARAILHNPRLVAFALARWAEIAGRPWFERRVRRLLEAFQRFEGGRFQYLTGSFVAARAVKPGSSP
jgi:SAM-dependent methyltransferase